MDLNDVPGGWVGAITTAVIGIAFAFRKMQSVWIKEGENQTISAAGASIIETLREEITRLSQANSDLNTTVDALRNENGMLKDEVATLRSQIRDLQHTLEVFINTVQVCSDCQYGETALAKVPTTIRNGLKGVHKD